MTTRLLAIIAALLTATATAPFAAQVMLKDVSGGATISGHLLDFDGATYRLETPDGIVEVAAQTVTCTGADCPEEDAATPGFTLLDSPDAPGVLAALMEAFSATLGATLLQTDDRLMISAAGERLADVTLAPIGAAPAGPVLSLTAARQGDAPGSVVALDAVVAAVSPLNSLDALTKDQLRRIADGRITNWKEVGGPDAAINLHNALLGPIPGAIARAERLEVGGAVQAVAHPRPGDAAVAVANDPYGLAFLPRSVLGTARALGLRGACGITIAPRDFDVQSGAFPTTFVLAIAQAGDRLPIFAEDFVTFLASDAAANVLTDYGFVSNQLTEHPVAEQGQRLLNSVLTMGADVSPEDVKTLAQMMSGATRLSATFRFRPGSTDLDALSRTAADTLAAELMLGRYADKIIQFAGFSDAAGGAARNASLSESRAKVVRDAVIAAGQPEALRDVTFEVAGYGEAAPLVCEDDGAGAAINRRVEVWVRDRGFD